MIEHLLTHVEALHKKSFTDYYNNKLCPLCEKSKLSNDKHHIFPEAVFKRLSNEKIFIFNNKSDQLQFENKIGHSKLKNGLRTKGLWCEECEKLSSNTDSKLINFLDNQYILEKELINFIRLLYLRFYLFLVKPHTNENTKLLADLLKYHETPSQYFIDAILYKQHHITRKEQFPIVLVCRINNLPFKLSFPQLHYLEKGRDERICLVIDNLFFQIFPGSQYFTFEDNGFRFNKHNEYNHEHPLNLDNFTLLNVFEDKEILKNEIPEITEDQFAFLWKYQ